MKKRNFLVSIIIPTYNRAKLLSNTLHSFITQNFPKNDYEILVVDNNSSDNTKEIVSFIQKKSPVYIRYLVEKRQGVHYARNTAALNSNSKILYFTDDDMIADKNLLKTLIAAFNIKHSIACVGGKILPKWENNPPKWILKYCYNGWLSLNDRKEKLIIASYDVGIYSCHQAILREVLIKSGGFNPENTKGEWLGDGETGLNIKIARLGYDFAYIGESIIYHFVPSSRMTQKYINSRFANQGRADSYTQYKEKNYSNNQLFFNLFNYFIALCKNLILVISKIIILSDSWRISLANISYYYNRMIYDYRLIKDENWRKLVLKNDWITS
ncbi:MAG: glycosyltransferase [Nitrososphaeraceae archaeon]|nr:glycosyltransferase [Nitrososphaeraceae archaeon]